MRTAFASLFILLLAWPCLSQSEISQKDFNISALAYDPEIYAFAKQLQAEVNISGLTGDWAKDAEFIAKNHALVVMGSNLDGPEKALMEAVKAKYPFLNNATQVPDNGDAIDKINSGKYAVVVLAGGPGQNFVTKEAVSRKWVNTTKQFYQEAIIQYGKTDKGVLVIAVSDLRGYANSNRESVRYSPLSAVIPQAYVPAAATGISIILLALFSVARTVFEFKALDIGRKGKKVGQRAWRVFGVNMKEILAVVGASFVLGVSISWQYFGPSFDFILWIFVNSFICLLAGVTHELAHRIFAFFFKIKVEYRFWPAGSFLTLLSSFLGNAFSVQGFLLEEIPKGTPKWKVGLMKVVAPMVSAAIMLFFALLNVFFPSMFFQTIYTTSALWAIAEMFPFSGLDGKDLKDWNWAVWLLAFAFVGSSYIFVTFIL